MTTRELSEDGLRWRQQKQESEKTIASVPQRRYDDPNGQNLFAASGE